MKALCMLLVCVFTITTEGAPSISESFNASVSFDVIVEAMTVRRVELHIRRLKAVCMTTI